jgi:hypothetical protein
MPLSRLRAGITLATTLVVAGVGVATTVGQIRSRRRAPDPEVSVLSLSDLAEPRAPGRPRLGRGRR